MYVSDLLFTAQWWGVLFVIGILFLPLSSLVFTSFLDKGYVFSKVLGIITISYIVFILGLLKILPFSQLAILLVIGFSAGINILTLKKYWKSKIEQFNNRTIVILLFEELLFFTTLLFWSYIRSFQPEIHGLEKYMDFGFVNSILKSTYFPPKDMWFTPHSINYYYFGHLVTAVLTKLSGIPSFITYNLMLATLFAFTFSASFSIGLNLFSRSRKGVAVIAGFLTAFLVSFAGNVHTMYLFFKPYNVDNPVPFWQLVFSPQTFPNAYWYPNATRFIQNTIHEFPLYSFVVSDLHGHVLSIPIVLTIIAVLLHEFTRIPTRIHTNTLVLVSFLLAAAYMTNAWDGPTYFLLTALVIGFLIWRNTTNVKYYKYFNIGLLVVLVCIGSILFALPFSLNFKPFVSGIGVLCAPSFLTNIEKLGPFLFEADHCLRSPLWQLFILYGFFYFWAILFLVFILRARPKAESRSISATFSSRLSSNNITNSDIVILFLIFLATLLIIIPEFFYIKDIYPAHYRANTMFKLVYESFIMLSLASGYIIMRLLNYFIGNWKLEIGTYWKFILVCIGSIGLLLIMLYPYFAINSYYGDLEKYQGLDGIKYLKKSYPTDYEAIIWLNEHISGQPVILEAQGDSYTDYGRISTNTGLPTVLGWPVHEWLWRGTYDIPSPRIAEVKTLYETTDIDEAKKLIDKYHIELIFIGSLEKEKYPDIQEEKFKKLGNLLFQTGSTKIYKINSF